MPFLFLESGRKAHRCVVATASVSVIVDARVHRAGSKRRLSTLRYYGPFSGDSLPRAGSARYAAGKVSGAGIPDDDDDEW